MQSNSARHHRKSLISNSVIGFPKGIMVFGGRQGYGTPTLENAFQVCGSMCPLVQVLMQGFKEDELGIQMPGSGNQVGKIVPFTIEMASKIYLAHLCYDTIELGEQYTWCQGCVLRSRARSNVTVREWFTEVMGTDFDKCCDIWPQLPVALTERAL